MCNDQPLAGCRIFVVEDEFFIAEHVHHLLAKHGAVVIGPYDEPRSALKRAIEDGFDVGVIDIDLQGLPAYEVADELMRQGIPFGFTTGYAPDAIPERFSDVPHWLKPFNEDTLLHRIAALYRKPKPA